MSNVENIELEKRIKKLIEIENFFDFYQALIEFEGTYKQTYFYKTTKLKLIDAVKMARMHYLLQMKDLSNKINKFLSTLDLDKVQELIEQFGNKLQTENSEIMAQIDALNLGELFKQ